jgi:hypothetical protein
MLVDLANQESLPSADLSSIVSPAADGASGPAVTVTLFGAVNLTPATVIRRMAPAALALSGENEKSKSVCHTLIILVENLF